MRSIPKTSVEWSLRRALPVAVAMVVCAAATLGGCRDNAKGPRFDGYGAAVPTRGGVLQFTIPQEVATLDPAIGYDTGSMYAIHHMYETLLGYGGAGQDSQLQPMLAETWSVSEDGATYSFTLRENLRYWDGTPCVADDIKYALERVLTIARSPFTQYVLLIEGAKAFTDGEASSVSGIRVFDDRRLEIRLREPSGAFVNILAMPFATPLSRAHVEAAGDDFRRRPLGTGPFMFDHWIEGTELSLQRNPQYWNPELPYVDGLRMVTSLPRHTAFLQLESGRLDFTSYLSSADYIWLMQNDAWRSFVQSIPGINTYGAQMNTSRPPFDDKRVRQAFNYAIDKHRLVKIWNGRAQVAHSMLPPHLIGHNPSLAPYPHDPDRARALLAEAGYPDGFDIEYAVYNDEMAERVAQSIQADLRAVGVRVTIQVMAVGAFLNTIRRPDGARFAAGGWLMDFPDPSNFLNVNFHSRSISEMNSNNSSFFVNRQLDAILDDALAETDADVRRQLYQRADALLHEQAPWVWGYHQAYTLVHQPYVRDLALHPVWILDLRAVWLDLGPGGTRVQRSVRGASRGGR